MKKILLVFFLFLSNMSLLNAQINNSWAIKFDGGLGPNSGNCVTTDKTGNVYSTGIFLGPTDFDPGSSTYTLSPGGGFITKTDPQGNLLWAKNFGDNWLYSSGNSILVDSLNNVYVAGKYRGVVDFDFGSGVYNLVSNSNSSDIFILKLDSNANLIWAKSIGSTNADVCHSLAIDGTGNILATGGFQGTADFNPDSLASFNLTIGGQFILKLDSNGSFIWAKKVEGQALGLSIDCNNQGDVFTTGQFQGTSDFDPGNGLFNMVSNNLYDIFILKLDVNGSFAWAKRIGGVEPEKGSSIKVDASGNSYIAGYYDSGSLIDSVDFDPGPGDFYLPTGGGFLLKLNPLGNFIWAKQVSNNIVTSIAIDNFSNIYACGESLSSMFITKIDSASNTLWNKPFGGNSIEICNYIAYDNNNAIVITGEFTLTTNFDPGQTNTSLSTTSRAVFISKYNQTVSSTTALADEYGIIVKPNPVTDFFKIENLKNLNTIQKYSIINYNGIKIIEDIYAEHSFIDVSKFQNGLYILQLKTKMGIINTKFLISH